MEITATPTVIDQRGEIKYPLPLAKNLEKKDEIRRYTFWRRSKKVL
jgi:hypothetical protein